MALSPWLGPALTGMPPGKPVERPSRDGHRAVEDLQEIGPSLRKAIGPRWNSSLRKPPSRLDDIPKTTGGIVNLGLRLQGAQERAAWMIQRSAARSPSYLVRRPTTQVNAPRIQARAQFPAATAPLRQSPVGAARDFIARNRDIFLLRDPEDELQIQHEPVDAGGRRHVKFQRAHRGVPVWGQDLVVHLDRDGTPYAVNARYSPSFDDLDVEPAVSSQRAIEAASVHLGRRKKILDLPPAVRDLLSYQGPQAALVIWVEKGTLKPYLAWHVFLRPNLHERWSYFIDAASGDVLDRYNSSPSEGPATGRGWDLQGVERTLQVYQAGSTYYLIDASKPTWQTGQPNPVKDPKGGILTLTNAGKPPDAATSCVTSKDNRWEDPSAVSAHFSLGLVFDYYHNVHGRRSLDGRGSSVLGVIHVADDDGSSLENAYWNGQFIVFGDGGEALKPLAGSLDVVAHEFGHGVIEATVNLEYRFQSGALSEALADWSAAMVDRDDWLIGEDVVNAQYFPSGALRNMEDPHNGAAPLDKGRGWQPAHMNEYQALPGDQDNGGVHLNSGIPNRMCFLMADGIGRQKTEQIYYRILEAQYLNTQSDFADFVVALRTSASELFGPSSLEVKAVEEAAGSVGLLSPAGGGDGPEHPQDVPPVQGDQWMAVANDEAGDHSLYLARLEPAQGDPFVQLTKTQVHTRSSSPITVTDDGLRILFVDGQNHLRRINSDGTDEAVVSTEGLWSSVALSPDGTKLAATTIFEDSTIYLFDLAGDKVKAAALYNPTTAEGVQANTVKYADALDWDLSGRFLLFDGFSSVPRAEGALENWAVYLMDTEAVFASEEPTGILSVFGNISDGISIGNPSFAQTTVTVFVFDIFDASTDTAHIWAADLYYAEAAPIVSNLANFGFPKYDPRDENVFFQQVLERSAILRIRVSPSKVEPVGDVEGLFVDGLHPVLFAVGSRPLPNKAPQFLWIDPPQGPDSGDTPVFISGRNFVPGETQVYFDDRKAGGTCDDVASFQGRSPAGLAGYADLKIVTPAGTRIVPEAYYYQGRPVAREVSPNRGSARGRQALTIKGRGLRELTSVALGGQEAPSFTAVSDETARCETPPWRGSAGPVDIKVTTRGGEAVLSHAFSYEALGKLAVEKGIAAYKEPKSRQGTWSLSILRGAFELLDPTLQEYLGDGKEIRVLLEGVEYFGCSSGRTVKARANKKTGAVASLTIVDSQKNRVTINFRKKTFSLKIRDVPKEGLQASDGISIGLKIADAGGFVRASSSLSGKPARQKLILLPATGTFALGEASLPCP